MGSIFVGSNVDFDGLNRSSDRSNNSLSLPRATISLAAPSRLFFPLWVNQDFRRIGADEWRALQQDLDVSGGYLVPPVQYMNDILKNIDDATYIRQWATTFKVTGADSRAVVIVTDGLPDSDRVDETLAEARRARELGVGLCALGVDLVGVDTEFLQQLTDPGGGIALNVTRPKDIVAGLHSLLE